MTPDIAAALERWLRHGIAEWVEEYGAHLDREAICERITDGMTDEQYHAAWESLPWERIRDALREWHEAREYRRGG